MVRCSTAFDSFTEACRETYALVYRAMGGGCIWPSVVSVRPTTTHGTALRHASGTIELPKLIEAPEQPRSTVAPTFLRCHTQRGILAGQGTCVLVTCDCDAPCKQQPCWSPQPNSGFGPAPRVVMKGISVACKP